MDICIYFQVHQPNRLRKYTFFDLGKDHFYEDDILNRDVLSRVAEKCYLPANEMILRLIEDQKGAFKVAYSLSGVFIEQLEQHRPDVLESFQRLAKTGCVEFLAETYHHSLASVYSKEDFHAQVKLHEDKINQYFGQQPKVFRNTELIYSNEIAAEVERLGYKGILSEGVNWYLNGRTPNQVYRAPNVNSIKTLLKNHKLSDDIAFRFGNEVWEHHPLSVEKYVNWVKSQEGEVVNLFIDYETIGEHKWEDTGIFEFWSKLPSAAIEQNIGFKTPLECIEGSVVKEIYDIPKEISWADTERDLSAWNGNEMQKEALQKVYALAPFIALSENADLLSVWRKLQTSDHFYYMSTKHENDGAVHSYFSPYNSPYDAYIYYMNVLSDLEIELKKEGVEITW